MQSEVSMYFDSKQCFLLVAVGLWEVSEGKKMNIKYNINNNEYNNNL